MLTENEMNFIKTLEDYMQGAEEATAYINENYNVNASCTYGCINFVIETEEDKENAHKALEYLRERLGNELLLTNIED